MRQYFEIHPNDEQLFKQQLCQASRNEGTAVILDGNGFKASDCIETTNNYDFIAGLQSVDSCSDDIEKLGAFHDECQDWLLGFLAYDVKNQLEDLVSNNPDRIGMPDMHFFRPRYLFLNDGKSWKVGYLDEMDTKDDVLNYIQDLNHICLVEEPLENIKLNHQVSHQEYLQAIEKVLWHIQRGDIYELNYCMEFFIHDVDLMPQFIYQRLKEVSPTPFSSFIKYHDKFLMGASPERYLKKEGSQLISQPIKGTSPRDSNWFIDNSNKQYLRKSEKEQAENIMITDLVRNDLSRVAKRGTVKVDELCGIYSFEQVHQMISTVSCQLSDERNWMDAIKTSFPMGSMTGAPKLSAMELIEEFECSKRGVYSGAVGYVSPEGDFDFNVVIRSILYNRKKQCASFMVGGAITNQSDPQQEYDECLLKASAIMKVFNIKN
ncbi:anthranilate synthase component I family protein [Carboxylicivirga sp. M1479]|uniref:anthranilate synthase component I family protein n=1 Tax=Carboxylicivirga sp. M1479 TaxID=2594476 RepID=UPI0011781481|nr:anthranilate synthase component I family protein [Carboxylicivirga sp. M1479]TRX71929.1 anthranilate synthase component I family protein [Carboxylicivirga sp. M1479]